MDGDLHLVLIIASCPAASSVDTSATYVLRTGAHRERSEAGGVKTGDNGPNQAVVSLLSMQRTSRILFNVTRSSPILTLPNTFSLPVYDSSQCAPTMSVREGLLANAEQRKFQYRINHGIVASAAP